MKKIINKNKLFYVYIPILLILFWFLASLAFNSRITFSVLTYPHSPIKLGEGVETRLYKEDSLSAEFTARENYLGIIVLGFKNYVRYGAEGEDVLLFRLKEKGSKDWQVINTYRAGILDRKLRLPLGFPIITDSSGKTYVFEIQSLYGNETNAIDATKISETYWSGYQIPKSEITKRKLSILSFAGRKVVTSFTDVDFLLRSLLYLLPLYFYAFFLTLRKFRNLRKYSGFIALSVMVLDITLLKEVYVGLSFAIALGWFVIAMRNKLDSRLTFLIAFFLIAVWLILTTVGFTEYNLKLNFWSFTMLLGGVVHLIYQELRSKNS